MSSAVRGQVCRVVRIALARGRAVQPHRAQCQHGVDSGALIAPCVCVWPCVVAVPGWNGKCVICSAEDIHLFHFLVFSMICVFSRERRINTVQVFSPHWSLKKRWGDALISLFQNSTWVRLTKALTTKTATATNQDQNNHAFSKIPCWTSQCFGDQEIITLLQQCGFVSRFYSHRYVFIGVRILYWRESPCFFLTYLSVPSTVITKLLRALSFLREITCSYLGPLQQDGVAWVGSSSSSPAPCCQAAGCCPPGSHGASVFCPGVAARTAGKEAATSRPQADPGTFSYAASIEFVLVSLLQQKWKKLLSCLTFVPFFGH